MSQVIQIPVGEMQLEAELSIPENAKAIIVFSHGSGSSRHSPRNKFVAEELQKKGLATLLVDLLSEGEDANPKTRFDIGLLTERLKVITEWIVNSEHTHGLKIGYFGASTGAASALEAAAVLGMNIFAVVSRGGRTDLAPNVSSIVSPTLLIVGENDPEVLELNNQSFMQLKCNKDIIIVPGATHLFEEPGALERVAEHAADWFTKKL